MASSKQIRAVLVGCGGMSRAWLSPAANIPGLKMVGLVDLFPEAAIDKAKQYKLPADIVFSTLKEAIKATSPDVVFDVTIPDAHDKVTLEALKAGCHVMGEKPMSVTLPRARKMVQAAKDNKRIYAVIQNRRYIKDIQLVAKQIHGGKIGDVEEVHSDFYLGPHFGGFRDEMEEPLLIDMAIHTFDQSRYIAKMDPVSVYCHGFNPKRSWYKGNASAVAIFEMKGPNGKPIVYTYRGSWAAEGLMTSWQSQWRIIGQKGTLLWDGEENISMEVINLRKKPNFTRTGKVTVLPKAKELKHVGHDALLREFISCVKNGGKPQTHCEDNIKSLAMVIAAVKSSKSGKREKVVW